MRSRYGLLSVLLVAVLGLGIVSGCAKPAPTPAPKAIEYVIPGEAAITQVSWYLNSGILVVDVKVKNTATTPKKYDVAVNVDGAGFFFAGVEANTEVKAGAEQVYKTQTSFSTPYPKGLQIRVTAK